MFSFAEGSFGSAVRELRDVYGRDLETEQLGPDLGVLAKSEPTAHDVATVCRSRPLAFIRHLTTELVRLPAAEAAQPGAVAAVARSLVADHLADRDLAVQTWLSGTVRTGYSSRELFAELSEALTAEGLSVSRAGRSHVLSGCIHPQGLSLALNRAEDSLSDWPGGRIRLAQDPAQISRAEFKLEELFATLPLPLAPAERALDLGASPGGWTRILRQLGLEVWAVDPGDLDPRLKSDPRVHHVRTTAGVFLRSTRLKFGLVANDMRMDPLRSCQVMLEAAAHLRGKALAIMTLKLSRHRPVDTVNRCLDMLRRSYDVVFVRQLHHNRQEVTVVAQRQFQ
jgi:23S rRNA (cytidine2498-2'-O)-methyltransferase